MPPRGRCGTTKCFRLGVPRTPRAARRGVSRVRWRRERARLAEIRSATRAAICERRFVARNQKKKTLVSGTHPSRRGFGRCFRSVARERQLRTPRGYHTATRAPDGRATAERRVEDAPGGSVAARSDDPPGPVPGEPFALEEKRASRGHLRARSSSCRVDSSRCRRRHRATAVSAQTQTRKPGGHSAPLVETRTSPRRAMGSRASPNPERSACASRAPNVSCSARSAAPSRRAETRSAHA